MATENKFLGATTIIERASEKYMAQSGDVRTLPIPNMENQELHVVVLMYRESTRLGDESIYPPHYIVTVNAQTGDIVDDRTCVPSDFGVAQAPGEPVVGFGIDPDTPLNEFWERRCRLWDISASIWEMYEEGAVSFEPSREALLREYDELFRSILKNPLRPYYTAIGSSFFEWMEQAIGRSPIE